ncbi:DUF2637 domain-containing protein [Actinoplanes sp. M2I2]|uniref:DUF2637 domain-containing protein n=1 Tax=Actinoplanes sp. M2I2 TaxID=1734444 RepID=UPI0020207DD7|nr:DUF2637 domain-containing protein [Actinoplanes sp. M2I2]
MSLTTDPNDLMGLAGSNRRVARTLADGQLAQVQAAQRRADRDAAAERRLREAEGRIRLTAERDRLKAGRAELRAEQREAERARKRERRLATHAQYAARWASATGYVRSNAAGVYSAAIYGLAVAGAVYGQIDAARLHDVWMPAAVVASIAIEGTGLAMALTAQQQRLAGERALAARMLVAVMTAAAVTINYVGHQPDMVKALGLSALSAIGIIVFEIRSGAKHRKALRAAGMIAEPGEQFGLRRWLAFPGETFAAWKLDVRGRLSPGAAALITRVERAAAERRRRAEIEAAAERRRALAGEVAKQARRAARKAARKGDAGAALSALIRLSHTGTPAPQLALPSRAHIETQTARAEAEAARAGLAEAEARAAEATAQAEAEATARATADRRAQAEAATRNEADRRAEAEATTARVERSRRAEAEAALTAMRQRAEAEIEKAARLRGHAETVGRDAEQLGQHLTREQQARTQAEARALAAERSAETLGRDVERLTRQLDTAAEQTTELREQLAAAEATLTARRQRAERAAAKPVELRFEGRPVPAVERTSPDTVLKILTAYRDNPTASQKHIATLAGTTDRTIRAVRAAAPDFLPASGSKAA